MAPTTEQEIYTAAVVVSQGHYTQAFAAGRNGVGHIKLFTVDHGWFDICTCNLPTIEVSVSEVD